MSPKEQKNIFVDKRGTKLKPQKRQIIDILMVIATTYLLHRKIEPLRKEISPPTKSASVMVPARCKLAYIRVGIIAIIGSAATGLISTISGLCFLIRIQNHQEDLPEDLPPHPTRLCERPARAKSPLTWTALNTSVIKQLNSDRGVLNILQISIILIHLGQV